MSLLSAGAFLFAGIVRTSQVIDYEETKQLEFTVIAYDSGVPQLTATAKVTVTVINVNDQDPRFEREQYNASIKENSPPGTRVIVVKATDDDEGPFGDVSYNLIGEHAADFNIGKSSSAEYMPSNYRVLMAIEVAYRVSSFDSLSPKTSPYLSTSSLARYCPRISAI